MNRSAVFSFLCLLVFASFGCSEFAKIQKSQDLEKKYDAAMAYFDKKDYYKAGMLLEELMPLLKGTEKAEKAQYYYGYCQFYEKQYPLASFYFKTFDETYPRSEYAEDAAYMEGLSLFEDSPNFNLDQESTKEAERIIQTFLNRFPESSKKEDCNYMIEKLRSKLEQKSYDIAKLYYRKGDYQAAIIALDNYRKDFPESKEVEETWRLRVSSAYLLAKASIAAKQEERYRQVLSLYEAFIDRYPESKKVKDVEPYYAAALDWLKDKKGKTETPAAEDQSALR